MKGLGVRVSRRAWWGVASRHVSHVSRVMGLICWGRASGRVLFVGRVASRTRHLGFGIRPRAGLHSVQAPLALQSEKAMQRWCTRLRTMQSAGGRTRIRQQPGQRTTAGRRPEEQRRQRTMAMESVIPDCIAIEHGGRVRDMPRDSQPTPGNPRRRSPLRRRPTGQAPATTAATSGRGHAAARARPQLARPAITRDRAPGARASMGVMRWLDTEGACGWGAVGFSACIDSSHLKRIAPAGQLLVRGW
jgi:hypothetical protein